MSVAITLSIAVLASALGGFAGSWYSTRRQISHEREENLRVRMLDAADNFSLAIGHALNKLHEAVELVPEEDLLDEDGQIDSTSSEALLVIQASRELIPLIDEVRTTLPRVHLLYGSDSATGRAAVSAVGHITTATRALNEELVVNFAQDEFWEAAKAHEAFTREARRALQRPSLDDPDESP